MMLLLSVCLQAAATPLHAVIAPQGSVRGELRVQNSDPMNRHVLVRRAASDEEDMAPRESRGLLTTIFRPFFGSGGGGGGGGGRNREGNGGRGGYSGRETPALPQRPARPILPPRAVAPPPNVSPQHIFIPIHDHNVVKFPGFPQPPAAPAPPRPKTTEEADPGLVYNFADPSEFSEPRPEDVINENVEGGYITLSPAAVHRPTPPISLEPPPYPFDVLKPPESPLPPAFRFPDSPSTGFLPPPSSNPHSKIRFPAPDFEVHSQQFSNAAPNIHSPFSPPRAKTQKKESADGGQRFTNFSPSTRIPQNEVNSVSHEPIKNFKDSPQDFPSEANINNFPIPTGSQFSEPLLPNDSGSLIPFGFGDDFFITGDVSGTAGLAGTVGISGTSDISGTGGISNIRDITGSGGISGTRFVSGTGGISDTRDVFGNGDLSGTAGKFADGASDVTDNLRSSGISGAKGTSDFGGTSGAVDITEIRDENESSAEQFSFVNPQPIKPEPTASTTSHPTTPQEKQNPISYQIQSWRLPSPQPATTQLPPVVKTEIVQLKPFQPQTTISLTTEADYVPSQTPVAVQQNQIPEQQFSNPVNPSPWPTTPHQEQNPTPAPPHWLNDGTSVSRFETTTSHQSPQTPSETHQVTENPWPNSGQHQNSQSVQGNFLEDSHVEKRENKVPPSTSTFDPLPAFSAEDLGPSGSTSLGFFPYENSDDFFNEVFKNSNPFGAKIVTDVTVRWLKVLLTRIIFVVK